MVTLILVESSPVVKDFEILEYYTGSENYVKIKAILINDSILYIREYFNEEMMDYSYHWQAENGDLIQRWDNAPYHKEISTFPHHRHLGSDIFPSNEIGLEEVLKFLLKIINS